MSKYHQVAIIGGSIAGSSTAILLAKAGTDVLLIEKSKFPRTKACGEGLSSYALAYLAELGVLEQILASEHAPFYGYEIAKCGYSYQFGYSDSNKTLRGIGIARQVIDTVLTEQLAKYSNIETHFECCAKEVIQTDSGFCIVTDKEQFYSKYLILADSLHSLMAKKLCIPFQKHDTGSYGSRVILEGAYRKQLDRILVFLKPDSEIYLTPLSSSKLNISILGGKTSIQNFSNKEYLQDLIDEVTKKAEFMPTVIAEKPLVVASLGGIKRQCYTKGVLLVGDVCESIDPISGLGMTHALLTSKLAANAIVKVLFFQAKEEEAFRQYCIEKENAVRSFRGFACLCHCLLRKCPNHALLLIASRTNLASLMRDSLVPDKAKKFFSTCIFNRLLHSLGA